MTDKKDRICPTSYFSSVPHFFLLFLFLCVILFQMEVIMNMQEAQNFFNAVKEKKIKWSQWEKDSGRYIIPSKLIVMPNDFSIVGKNEQKQLVKYFIGRGFISNNNKFGWEFCED
jgi:hypothetical protein